jgi:hypothetical protein
MTRAPWQARCGWPLLALCLAALPGCRGRVPAPADPGRGREALHAALDAWEKGETPESLRQRTPPIYVTDTDWLAGQRLVHYQLKDKDEYHGSQFRCWVVLSLQSAKGGRKEKTVSYLIDTQPALVIVRGDMYSR